jgi:hypothetical protein
MPTAAFDQTVIELIILITHKRFFIQSNVVEHFFPIASERNGIDPLGFGCSIPKVCITHTPRMRKSKGNGLCLGSLIGRSGNPDSAHVIGFTLHELSNQSGNVTWRVEGVGIHPHDDLALGGPDSDVHARWGNLARIIQQPNPQMAKLNSRTIFTRPVIALTIHDQQFESILGKVACDD